MKKSFLITLLGIVVAGVAIAQSEETRSLSSFSRVSAHEGVDVYLKEGNKEEARVVSDDIDLEDVLTDVRGDQLKIHLEGSNHRNVNVKVYVTYKSLRALSASSAASVVAQDRIETDGDFDFDVSSAGDIKASIKADELDIDASSAGGAELKVEANKITIDVSSAGDIRVTGSARYQDIEASSSGDYDGYEVACEEANIRVSSGGSIKIQVATKIDARASSGGSVRYKGSPKYVNVNSSSGGSVKKL